MKTLSFILYILVFKVAVAQIEDPVRDTLNSSTDFEFTDPANNIWQVGKPSKKAFVSDYSGDNDFTAIVTDTLKPYPVNNNSAFRFKIKTGEAGNIRMRYLHQFHSDTLKDFGIVNVSYDKGITWKTLRDTMDYPFQNESRFTWMPDYIENESKPHLQKSSGSSGGKNDWYRSGFEWLIMLKVRPELKIHRDFPDSIYVEFKFQSDNIDTQKDGWIIDQLVIERGGFSGIADSIIPKNRINVFLDASNETIRFTATKEKFNLIQIFGTDGKMVREAHNIHTTQWLFNTKLLRNGVYYWRVIDRDGVFHGGKIGLIQ